jgi:hypothetical protein
VALPSGHLNKTFSALCVYVMCAFDPIHFTILDLITNIIFTQIPSAHFFSEFLGSTCCVHVIVKALILVSPHAMCICIQLQQLCKFICTAVALLNFLVHYKSQISVHDTELLTENGRS